MLRGLPQVTDERLIVGHGTFDDGGVFVLNPEQALVQTVDFFPPVTDDPRLFGQIAAANALSDVYAMGGTVLTAMGLVCFPVGDLPMEALGEILKGGAEKVHEAGGVVVGGHSIVEKELKFGLAVTGQVHPKRVASNAGARAGDVLFLTKSLGMGPVTTAYRAKKIDEKLMGRACAQMAQLNKAAGEAMSAVGINEERGVHAATDITGFGLLGHARNMAKASGVTLRFDDAKIPVFDGAEAFAAKKLVSGAMASNEQVLGGEVEVGAGVPEARRRIYFDSETSGGLLIAVAPDGAGRLAAELRKRGVLAAEVGAVEARGAKQLRVV